MRSGGGDPPSRWRGYGVTMLTGNWWLVAGGWWLVEKIWNRGKFACGIDILDCRRTRNLYEK